MTVREADRDQVLVLLFQSYFDLAARRSLNFSFFTGALSLLLLLVSSVSGQASFPLIALPAFSSVAPCATGELSHVFNSLWYDGCSSNLPIKRYGSCLCAYRMTDVSAELSQHFSFDAECSSSGVDEVVTQLCGWAGVDLAKVGEGGGSPSATTTAAGGGSRPTSVATPRNTISNSGATSTSNSDPSSPCTSPDCTGKKHAFGALTMDEVIALAVGIPSIILAGLAVWYAKRNHAFQKMKMYMKKHKPASGHQHAPHIEHAELEAKNVGYNATQGEMWGGQRSGYQGYWAPGQQQLGQHWGGYNEGYPKSGNRYY